MPPLPVFLISFNRGKMLEQAVAALQRMSRPTQIVVHDNGSSDPATLQVLQSLDASGIQVLYRQAITTPDELNRVDDTVQTFFSGLPDEHYIVSDCDIDMSCASPFALDVFMEMLDIFPEAECVGPMLRIRDVPTTYPLFNHMMNRHIEQFWKYRPRWTETSLGRVAYIEAPFDTTLALHRRGQTFCRFRNGLRVYEPYEARHLDWYLEPGEMEIYAATSGTISHWNNKAEFNEYRDAALLHSRYYAVRSAANGLEEYQENVAINNEINNIPRKLGKIFLK